MTNATEQAPKLVADIGGTNARFALIFDDLGKPMHEHLLSCIDFTGPVAAIEHYLGPKKQSKKRRCHAHSGASNR